MRYDVEVVYETDGQVNRALDKRLTKIAHKHGGKWRGAQHYPWDLRFIVYRFDLPGDAEEFADEVFAITGHRIKDVEATPAL